MADRIYSFDVFDTCLVRNFSHPHDLYRLLAKRMLWRINGNQDSLDEVAKLARLRLETEARVRLHSPQEDICIDDIYGNFEELKSWGILAEDMKREELSLEKQSVRPIFDTRRRVNSHRHDGSKIIFVSDMYLPEFFIRQMLEENGLASKEDRIYVSGEVGLTKSSGRLFQYVLEREAIEPRQLVHYGDNYRSDFLVPKRLGIQTSLIKEVQLNRYERDILKN